MRMEDIQQAADRIRNAVRTETVDRDTVMAVDIVYELEMEMKLVLKQEEQRLDTGLMLEECRKVDSQYILPCFPYLSLYGSSV